MSLIEEFVHTISLKGQMDTHTLVEVILAKLRRHTVAEAGSIFMVENLVNPSQEDHLVCYSIQNDKVQIDPQKFSIPQDETSIAGYVACTGDVLEIDNLYALDVTAPYSFNPSFDRENNYQSKSMLSFPLKNIEGSVIGVIQLINHFDIDRNDTTAFKLEHMDDARDLMPVVGLIIERCALKEKLAKEAAA